MLIPKSVHTFEFLIRTPRCPLVISSWMSAEQWETCTSHCSLLFLLPQAFCLFSVPFLGEWHPQPGTQRCFILTPPHASLTI